MAATATSTDGAAATAPTVYNGLGGAATTSSSGSTPTNKSNRAQASLDLGRSYGVAIIVAGLFAGFALVI